MAGSIRRTASRISRSRRRCRTSPAKAYQAGRPRPQRRSHRPDRVVNFQLAVASNFAPAVDHILICLLVISGGMLLLVFWLMWSFMIRYRVGSPVDRGAIAQRTWRFEIAWTA